MPKEKQLGLSDKEKEKLLDILEKEGREKWYKRWKEHMAIPSNLDVLSKDKDEREKILRYLLLRVLINQQARFDKVREISIRISEEFTDILLSEPFKISESELFKVFKDVAGESRMFVNWMIFLFNEIWKQKVSKMEETLMIVDGHVGKVFCRTGLLEEVLYEERRPYIIQASKMRLWIEEIISRFGKIPFYVDNGAFYLFEDGYCRELKPNCKDCPLNKICKKYLKWTAYQIWEK